MTGSGEESILRDDTVEFSIHGVVAIKVIADGGIDPSWLPDYLGEIDDAATGEADIVARLDTGFDVSEHRLLGLDFAGYTPDDFFVFHSESGRPLARLPVDAIGDRLRFECHPAFLRHPLFHSILIVTLLAKGHVPLHASAFRYQNEGVLVVGWEKGGKTETLLAFANRGAEYVGDEWVILAPDGGSMFGLPFKVTVWDWQFPYVRGLLPPLRRRDRLLFRTVRVVDAAHARIATGPFERLLPVGILGRALPSARRQLRIRALPPTLFGNRLGRGPTPLDRAVLVVGHDQPAIAVQPIDPSVIARRMPASNLYEYSQLLDYYRAFRFAFPDRANPLLDELDARTRDSLATALEGIAALEVAHPYPVSLDALFDAVAPVLGSDRGRGGGRSVDAEDPS